MSSSRRSKPNKLVADNPIKDGKEDRLGRLKVAEAFADNVLRYDFSKGLVVGVFGPWGSGKTSFMNLARTIFEKRHNALVVEFNPWMFSNSQQLVERFFTEIASQIDIPEYKDLGINMAQEFKFLGVDLAIGAAGELARLPGFIFRLLAGDYATSINDLMGTMTRRDRFFFRFLEKRWDKYEERVEAKHEGEGTGIITRRKNIEQELEGLGKGKKKSKVPIIVIVDDVDRLSNKEIGDVLKLVRLTGSFPNIIYIVPCDRMRIEEALGEDHGIGRDFLEKIIQFSYDLPEINRDLFIDEINRCLDSAVGKDQEDINKEILNAVRDCIIHPLVQNMRDLHRYSSTISTTLSSLDGKVEQADILALEAIRLFIPDVFRLLPDVVDILSRDAGLSGRNGRHIEASKGSYHRNEKYRGIRLAKLFENAQEHAWVIYGMVEILFPDAIKYLPRLEHNEAYAVPNVIPANPADHSHTSNDNMDSVQTPRNRVANVGNFHLYLDRIPNEEIETLKHAEDLLECLPNADRLKYYLRDQLDRQRFHKVIKYLYYHNEFSFEHIEPGIVELSNHMMEVCNMNDIHLESEMPDPNIGSSLRVVVSKLLELYSSHDDEYLISEAGEIFSRLFNSVKPLSVKYWLVEEFDRQDGQFRKFILKKQRVKIDNELRDSIADASVDNLAREWALPEVLSWSKLKYPTDVMLRENDHTFTFLILWAFRSVGFYAELGQQNTLPSAYERHIIWNKLIECYDVSIFTDMAKAMCKNFDKVRVWARSKGLSDEDIDTIREEAEAWLDVPDTVPPPKPSKETQ